MSDAARAAAEELEAIAHDGLGRDPRRRPLVWVVYAVLYAVAVPWYWPTGYRGPLVFGLPLWVFVTLAAVLALGLWTARVLAVTREDGAGQPGLGREGAGENPEDQEAHGP